MRNIQDCLYICVLYYEIILSYQTRPRRLGATAGTKRKVDGSEVEQATVAATSTSAAPSEQVLVVTTTGQTPGDVGTPIPMDEINELMVNNNKFLLICLYYSLKNG